MRKKLQRLNSTLANCKGPILLPYNAQPHIEELQKLNELCCETLPRPAHFPDLSSTDYSQPSYNAVLL
ncbi:Histone-lysine N-methyltransferase SETMAR [Habropoda laboriosa]|uniref:Histone-lysine N-methyltransferase SETMAR n=1 Tax=Habropoda laboriosa TaxID=597456 RepID=A0A0L7R9R4_9HYME|nr:Histone-lysine N-methyltransferase SETMAR [Habropoda laboriosa]